MKILYKKRRLNYNLTFGIFWLVLSLLKIFNQEKFSWFDWGFLILSFLYLRIYFYEKKNQYLTIENGMISINKMFPKRIKLTEIKQIKKFAGDYILKTDKTALTINTQFIDENSLKELNTELEKLNIEWN